MHVIRAIFNLCSSIMYISINLYGYNITLWQVCLFGFIVFVLGRFVFRIFY